MDKIKILWADDEIDLLKPQLMFLEQRGYAMTTVTNGYDAIDACKEQRDFDVVFLDESMPGITGLETLGKIKETFPHLPIVMITKNEAENIMDDAIGSQISDYLIKPVNPNQILLSLKKIIDSKQLVQSKTSSDYQQDFRQIFMEINSGLNYNEWADVYRKIIGWELKLDAAQNTDMSEIVASQKAEANSEFSKFVSDNYESWVNEKVDERPNMSYNLMRNKIFPYMKDTVPTVVVLLDNLRFDQWKIIEPIISELFRVEEEDFFFSILPTATQYSRNAIFAGQMPLEIEKHHPQLWRNDIDEGGKNLFEDVLLKDLIKRSFKKEIKSEYIKVTNVGVARTLQDNILNLLRNNLSVIVYNFIDMLSHARTEMEVLKELAGDETAYRSLTRSWFLHSPLWAALQKLADKEVQLIFTTDHGTIRVKNPSKVVGDKETTTNLRYKVGRNLQYERKDVLENRDPKKFLLPSPNLSSTFIFAKSDSFFVYPNNQNHFSNYYKNTFQHGGISLEEVICPIIRVGKK